MTLPDSLEVDSRRAWRAWLRKHHESASEVWLVFLKPHVSRRSVDYEDAVREALCFGWIDGKIRRIDDDRYARRFSPRRPGSAWSESNRRRVRELVAAKQMTPAGLAAFASPPRANQRPAIGATSMAIPNDLAKALAKHGIACDNFAAFPPSARRAYLYWITTAKRAETRARRIREAVERIAGNERSLLK